MLLAIAFGYKGAARTLVQSESRQLLYYKPTFAVTLPDLRATQPSDLQVSNVQSRSNCPNAALVERHCSEARLVYWKIFVKALIGQHRSFIRG